jgi:hypothetical protein
MSVRDLGYRAYEGELRAPSENIFVLLRYGLWRIWGSWINRVLVVAAIFIDIGWFIIPFLRFWILGLVNPDSGGRDLPEVPPDADPMARWFGSEDPGIFSRPFVAFQIFFFLSIVTLRSGAGVIAEDFTNKAYQFYFAKPVTQTQYLLGRIGALAIFMWALIGPPTCIFVFITAALGPEDMVWQRTGLIFPALFDTLIISVTCALLSVAVSAMSKSRALTMTAWAVLLFVPLVLATLVEGLTQSEWMHLASLPSLLWIIGDGLFRIETSWETVSWYHAAPVLAILCGGAAYLTWWRIRQAEVIT